MNDLFGDLPAAAGDDGTATPGKTSKNAAILLRPRATSSNLMPPPKRPVAARPASSMVPPHARPRAVVAQAPIEIHAQSKHVAAVKAAVTLPHEGGYSDFEELSCEGEAYDPSRPNDYMEYCKERNEKKKQEERDREYEKYKKERGEDTQRGQGPLPGLGASNVGGQGQSVAPPSRGRGRGNISNLPSWMAKMASSAGGESGGAAAMPSLGSPEGRFEDAQITRGPGFGVGGGGVGSGDGGGKGGIGAALLKKLGYKEGGGLGKDGQGITQAIQARAIGGGKGMISGPPQGARGSQLPAMRQQQAQQNQQQQQQQQQQQKKKKRGLFSNPTKVVLLKNMVGPGQVDDDLQAETAEECSKHGTVAQCLIFEVVDEAYPEEERVRTFVAFDRQESAVKTYVAMNGRFFGGRQVQASFFDEDRFARKDLAPREGE